MTASDFERVRQTVTSGSRTVGTAQHGVATASGLVESMPEAAFAVDERDRIVAWNAAAGRLLGVGADAAVGCAPGDVLDLRDLFGNRDCRCVLHAMVRGGELVQPYDLVLRHPTGGSARLNVATTLVVDEPRVRYCLVHVLREVRRRRAGDRLPGETVRKAVPAFAMPEPATTPTLHPVAEMRPLPEIQLTRRETEILRHLAAGTSTEKIADALGIRVPTVRTHVQNLLGKLGVRSRVEAVILALRTRQI